jgi:hypothetical protein
VLYPLSAPSSLPTKSPDTITRQAEPSQSVDDFASREVLGLFALHWRLCRLQPWAYNTLECYGCSGCETYPTQPITFTDNKLFQNGVLLPVNGSEWKSNPKPAKKLMCKESTAIAENGDTTISFA